MRFPYFLLLIAVSALSVQAQSYQTTVMTGVDHDAADRATHDCTANPSNPIANCSFETGTFDGWIAEDILTPYYPLEVNTAGVDVGFGFFVSAPTNGTFAALNGFDGDGPGVIRLSQDVPAQVCCAMTLLFDYRAAWDLQNYGALLDREFQVVIEPSGGGTPLATFPILTAQVGTVEVDTGDLEASVDLSAFLGQPFRLVFEWTVPELFSGPAFFQLDNVNVDTVLPVELTGFAGIVDGTAARLTWATASETNNAGFEVQTRAGADWSVLGFVDGAGTTTEAQTYGFTAANLRPGTHTFRLKQIDFDGAFEYSAEVDVVVGLPGTHALTTAYPNPFNPSSQFTLAVAQEQRVTVGLHNLLGQRLAVVFDGTLAAGAMQTLTLDGTGLPSGAYVVRAEGATFTDTFRVTLLK